MPAIIIFLLKSIRFLYLLKSIALCISLNWPQLLYLDFRNPAYKLYLLTSFPVLAARCRQFRNLYHDIVIKIVIGISKFYFLVISRKTQKVTHESNEKNFSIHIFAMSKFCSAPTITVLFSYLTLIDFNVLWYRLNFFPASVIMILSTISICSLRSHLIFLSVVVRGISLFSNTISLKDFELYITQFIIFTISSSA